MTATGKVLIGVDYGSCDGTSVKQRVLVAPDSHYELFKKLHNGSDILVLKAETMPDGATCQH